MTLGKAAVLITALGWSALRPSNARAQVEPGRAVIAGTIRSTADSTPLAGTEVLIVGSREQRVTNDSGEFRFIGIYPGRYEIRARRLGFEQLVKFVTVGSREVSNNQWSMRPIPRDLPEVRVNGRMLRVSPFHREAYHRAAMGFGDFIMREEIDRRQELRTVDLLDRVPGAHIEFGGGVSFARCPRGVAVFLDGVLATRFTSVSDALQRVRPNDIEMIEVYGSALRIPGEFYVASGACGVVAIWTRRE